MSRIPLNALACFAAIIFVLNLAGTSVAVTTKSHRRIKRQSPWTPTDTTAFAIDFSRDASGRYVTDIKMGEQSFNFLLSTSSGYTAVAGSDCETCAGQIGSTQLYDEEASNTVSPLNGTATIQIDGSSVSGDLVKEDCYFRMQNGTHWAYKNQTVVVADNSTGIFGNGAAGVIGLGRSGGADSIVAAMFRDHPKWQNISFGLALNSRQGLDDFTTQAGSLTVRELDDTQYVGDIPWEPVARADDVPDDVPKDWALRLSSWSLKMNDTTISTQSGRIAIVEPYFPEIRFPQEEARKFYRLIDGTSLQEDATGLSWTLPCDQKLTLDVVFGANTFTLETEKLVLRNADTSSCTGAVRGWADSSVTSYLLGSAFAETAYIAYLANPNSDDDMIGVAPRTSIISAASGRQTPLGAIIGASVGGFLVLLLILGAVMWYRKRQVTGPAKTPEKPSMIKVQSANTITPYPPQPNSATPMLTMYVEPSQRWVPEQGPIGGERTADELNYTSAATSPSNSPSYLGGYPVLQHRSPKIAERFAAARNSALTTSSGHSPGAYQETFLRTNWPSVSSASGTPATHLAPPRSQTTTYTDIPDDPAPSYAEANSSRAIALTAGPIGPRPAQH